MTIEKENIKSVKVAVPYDMSDFMLQLLQSKDADFIGDIMKKTEMAAYVAQHHNLSISQVASGAHQGSWKTHYYVGKVRKNLYKKNRDDLIEFLYHFYKEGEGAYKTFGSVHEELMKYKRESDLCSQKTIEDWNRIFHLHMVPLAKRSIDSITEDELRSWITNTVLPTKPLDTAFKRVLYNMKSVFRFARKRHYTKNFPEEYIEFKDYRKHCRHVVKREEDSYFSEEETERIRQEMWQHTDNPRALIALLNIETGMRADEPVALHKSDVFENYIDIHRQQLKLVEYTPPKYVEVDYTKDTRTKANNGRWFPITPRIREILDLAMQLPGESEYLFHDENGDMITKDTYERFLRRHCQKLGLHKTNNHSFRKGLNNNVFIPEGIPANERANLLGHSVRTNEQNYSLKRTAKVSELGQILANAQRRADEKNAQKAIAHSSSDKKTISEDVR